jgi:hypothetical protein
MAKTKKTNGPTEPTVDNNPQQPNITPTTVDPALIALIRQQVLEELRDDKKHMEADAEEARAAVSSSRQRFVEEMKASSEPWVDIITFVQTPQGIKFELDWNDAFIKYLEENSIKGTDEEATVQRWISLLLREISIDMEHQLKPETTSEFE